MAVPKRRMSSSRQGMRRSHHHLTPTQVQYCGHCEQPVLPHRICGHCGWYQGRQIVETKEKKKKESEK